MESKKCAVCGIENVIVPMEHHFQSVCEKHAEFANYFQLDAIKLMLGFIDKLPDSCYQICDKPLSKEENATVGHRDFIKTCTEHRWMSKFYMYSQFREQYKKGYPFSHAGKILTKEFPHGAVFVSGKNIRSGHP